MITFFGVLCSYVDSLRMQDAVARTNKRALLMSLDDDHGCDECGEALEQPDIVIWTEGHIVGIYCGKCFDTRHDDRCQELANTLKVGACAAERELKRRMFWIDGRDLFCDEIDKRIEEAASAPSGDATGAGHQPDGSDATVGQELPLWPEGDR